MSLREEIAGMRVRTWKNLVGDDLAEEIINKILDAAVEAVIEIYDPDFPPTAAVNAINKLRGK